MSAWLAPSSRLGLAGYEVHVWRASLDLSEECWKELGRLLSADEQTRASRYRFDRPAHTFIVARGVLRLILSRYLGTDPQQLQFRCNPHGKPELADPRQSWLRFSVAHSGDWAVYALACGRSVGIDLEAAHRTVDMDLVVAQCFSPTEQLAFTRLPPGQQPEGFFRAWTRKEAYVKARGTGFNLPPNLFSVSLAPDTRPELLNAEGDAAGAEMWSILDVEVAPGYKAALAVPGPAEPLLRYSWQAS